MLNFLYVFFNFGFDKQKNFKPFQQIHFSLFPFFILMSNEKYPISLLFLRLSLCFFSLPVASAHRVYYANEPLLHSA